MTSVSIPSLAGVPKAGSLFSAAIVLLTLAGGLSSGLLKALVLVPGNTILGSMYIWNAFTYAFIEPNPLKLVICLFIITRVGWTAESPASDLNYRNAKRVLLTVALAVLTAGLIVSASGLAAYMGSGVESYLYKPLYGSGPIAVAVAVCAHQIAGDSGAAISTSLPWLPVSLVPVSIIAFEAVCQYVLRISRGFMATCVSLLAAWLYLRFFHVYAPGSIGDGRPCFELLSFLPGPLQLPLRPFVNLLSPMLLSLPIFAATTGDGMTSLPSMANAGGVSSGGVTSSSGAAQAGASPFAPAATVTDAVLERRREIALAQLDRRLAELRSGMAAGGRGVGGSRTPVPAAAATPLSMAAALPAVAPAAAPAVAAPAGASSEAPSAPVTEGAGAEPVSVVSVSSPEAAVAAADASAAAAEGEKA